MRKLLIATCGLLMAAACSPAAQEEKDIETLKQEIQEELSTAEGDFAVAFRLLDGSGEEILINEMENFHAASTMKTPVMIEVYKQAAAGKFNVSDSIQVHNEFKSIVDGSLYSMQLGVDSEEELYDRIGKKATIYDITYAMIIKSSNLATNILIDLIGAESTTQTMRDLGAADIMVKRGVEDQKAFDQGLNNTTTAYDLMVIMEAIANGDAVNEEADAEMFDILADQYYRDLIPAYLPENVVVAHKTGFITGVQHDSGIIRLPDGRQYVLVLLSKNLANRDQGKEAMARVSKLIYDYVIK
ncbi:serine hydrolase [Litoribacter ruber]|uniref:serine hydrolase n=1 Tax=Litoribacter ruber TaxID=702568 RepID=UPI001BDA44B8|nr:serine hydrolase [Litoribacter ruber]MBT0812667.1 serine hydrolase [Litoribacter ruber]